MTGLRDRAAIVGIGATEFSKNSGRSELQLAVECIRAALEDAGLTPADVRGLVSFTLDSSDDIEVARTLGIPELSFFSRIPHGGGAVPFHWGRYRGLAQDMGKPPLDELLLDNVFFDTCVYHQPGIDLMTKVIPIKNILFASEMVGAVRGIDPETGFPFDDTKRYVDGTPDLSDAERTMIFEGNVRNVFSRLKA